MHSDFMQLSLILTLDQTRANFMATACDALQDSLPTTLLARDELLYMRVILQKLFCLADAF